MQLVDDVLLYQRIDGRDHVPIEVRAVRPAAADRNALRVGLDDASFWLWPRRWPRVDDHYTAEFVIAVEWAGRATVSAGPIGVARVLVAVLEDTSHVVGDAAQARAAGNFHAS